MQSGLLPIGDTQVSAFPYLFTCARAARAIETDEWGCCRGLFLCWVNREHEMWHSKAENCRRFGPALQLESVNWMKKIRENFAVRIFCSTFAPLKCIEVIINIKRLNEKMIVVPVKEGENIERALKKFKRKFEKTGVTKELRRRQQFDKPSELKRLKMEKAIYVQQLHQNEE